MSNIHEIGVLELQEYIEAYYMLPRVKAEKEDVIASLYDDCDPTITWPDYDLGVTRTVSVRVEDMAILIIDRKEEYDRMIKRYEYKAELFESALDNLSPREKDVIAVRYFKKSNDMGLTLEYFHKTLKEAEGKLCSTICTLKSEGTTAKDKALKEERRQKVQQWKMKEAL